MNAKKKQNSGGQKTSGAGTELEGDALIARLAYDKWQARGCPVGDEQRDWFEAEQEVRAAGSPRDPSAESSAMGERAS
jgi:hypothetical protein